MIGFDDAPTATLLTVRDNMLRGLAVVVAHNEAGTLDATPEFGKAVPPVHAGHMSLTLVRQVDAVLVGRGIASALGEFA